MYDYIIIGGGISGLYLNFLLSKNNKTLLLEKNNHLGGRIYNEKFYDTEINTGARVGGLHNKYLMRLIRKLKMPYKNYDEKINIITNEKINLRKIVKNIIKKYNSIPQYETKSMTAKEFIIKYFGKKIFEEYQRFIEYTDFFENSIETYVKLYPIVDHIPAVSEKNLIKIDWNLLTLKISEYIQKYNEIKTDYNVRKIIYNNNHYIINDEFKAKKIVLCVTINPLKSLIKKSNLNIIDYSKYLDSVEFLRIFTYHKDGHNLKLDNYNIVGGLLHKIIIESDTVLTMVEVDSLRTREWKKIMYDKEKVITKLKYEYKKIFNKNIQIDDVKIVYWKNGVHYYKPGDYNLKSLNKQLIHPYKKMYVCGEICGFTQGWVEGALECVNKVYKLLNK